MRIVDFNYLQKNHSYYIYQLEDKKKHYGKFEKLYDYDYFYIAVFKEVLLIPYAEYINVPPLELHFVINSYHDNIEFYIPEIEPLFLKQILHQKTKDENLAKTIASIYN